MDERDPEIEGMLQRTAHRPSSRPDPEGIARRARRRTVALRAAGAAAALGVVAVAAVAAAGLLPGQGTDVVLGGGSPSPAPTPSPSPAPTPSPSPDASPSPTARPGPTLGPTGDPSPTTTPTPAPAAPPEVWVGVREAGEELEVVLHDAGGERTLARHPRSSPEAGDTYATDVVVDEPGGHALVALCCEPVSGSLFTVPLEGEGGALEPATIQGLRADLDASGSLFARTDTYGILGIQPAFPSVVDQEIRDGASAADVGVEPGAGGRVAALVDPELASMPVPEPTERGVLVLERAGDGTWGEEFVPLEARACALVFLAGQRVGLLHASDDGGEPGDVLRCTGERLDVLDLTTGAIEEGAVVFDEPVEHLSADTSGEYVIATGASGAVRWATPGGESGELAGEGYVAADW